jgi:hypothetical protein
VYDENGKLVARDDAANGDDRKVFVTPKWTATFTIEAIKPPLRLQRLLADG